MDVVEVPPEEPRRKGLAVVAATVMAALIAALLLIADRPAHKAVALAPVKAPAAAELRGAARENWAYTTTTVEMTGEAQDLACTTSSEGARLCFRTTGSKLESFLSFPEGDQQFLCTRYHCTTQIKIDDQPVFGTVGSESPDGNIAMVYLGQPERLLSLLRTARQAELGPPMYEQDGLVLHFHVSGLKDLGEKALSKPATVGSGLPPRGVDPRLLAPITPVFPPSPTPQTSTRFASPRLGVA